MNYYIDGARDVVVIRVRGRWKVVTMLDTLRRVVADPRFRPDQTVLVDCRRAIYTGPSSELREIVVFADTHTRLQRCALLTSDAAGWGMARMFVALAGDDGARYRPFREYDAACRWLGVQDLPDHAGYGRSAADPGAPREDDSSAADNG